MIYGVRKLQELREDFRKFDEEIQKTMEGPLEFEEYHAYMKTDAIVKRGLTALTDLLEYAENGKI